jgi:hypothetical protein
MEKKKKKEERNIFCSLVQEMGVKTPLYISYNVVLLE